MKVWSTAAAVMMLALIPQFASAAAEPIEVSSRINRVTVFSDRAQVTRTTQVSLGSQPKVFAFRALPGWVDDGSVRVSVAGSAKISDVAVKREFLARSTDKKYQEAEAALVAVQARKAELTDELAILRQQGKQIASISAFSLEKISRDTVLKDINVTSYAQVIKFIATSLRATAKARRQAQAKLALLLPELTAASRRLQELKSLTQLEQTTVLVTITGASGGDVGLELTYMLPGATWQPAHELRVQGEDPKSAEMASYAVVSQTTGEDWDNAQLSFATQSSTEAIRIPELEALTLGEAPRVKRVARHHNASFKRAQKAFMGQNMLWNKVQRKQTQTNFEQTYSSNFQSLQLVQSKTVEIFRSLQKRGTTAHFKGDDKATVRGDGHPVRVRIGKKALAATQRIVAAPEQSLNAARTLRMTNSTAQSLLPGKVALYRGGSFLGMTDLAFVAEGETFAVFLNVADHLKLSRILDKKHSSVVRKRKTRMQVAFVVRVENLSEQPTTFTLADRVPVSEDKDIKIDKVSISPPVTPNSRGLLAWELTLQPGETRELRIGYRVEYPPTLILETKRAQQQRMRKKHRPAAKSRVFDFNANQMKGDDAYELKKQIMNLESEL